MTFTRDTKEHKLTAKIICHSEPDAQFHNDPSRGYKHFATDIKDFLVEELVDNDGEKLFEKLEVNSLGADLENPKYHYASIYVKTIYTESRDEVWSIISGTLEEELPALKWHLEELKEVPEEEN